jgi:hypothetical protein
MLGINQCDLVLDAFKANGNWNVIENRCFVVRLGWWCIVLDRIDSSYCERTEDDCEAVRRGIIVRSGVSFGACQLTDEVFFFKRTLKPGSPTLDCFAHRTHCESSRERFNSDGPGKVLSVARLRAIRERCSCELAST